MSPCWSSFPFFPRLPFGLGHIRSLCLPFLASCSNSFVFLAGTSVGASGIGGAVLCGPVAAPSRASPLPCPGGTRCRPEPHCILLRLCQASSFSFQEIESKKDVFIQHLPFMVLFMHTSRSVLALASFLPVSSFGSWAVALLAGRVFSFCVFEKFFSFLFYSFFLRKSVFCLHLRKPFPLGIELGIPGVCSFPVSAAAVLRSGARRSSLAPLRVSAAPFLPVP